MNAQELHAKALEVYSTVKEHLDDHHMHYQANDKNLAITLISVGDDLPMPLLIEVHEDRQVLRLVSPLPAKMPEDKRVEGAIATSVANYGLINGSFDYDMRDGEIRFRITTGYHGTKLSKDLVHYLIACTLSTVDHYNDKFFTLAKGMTGIDDFIGAEK